MKNKLALRSEKKNNLSCHLQRLFIAVSILFCLGFSKMLYAKDIPVSSPDGQLTVQVHINKEISWSASYKQVPIFENSRIALSLSSGKELGIDPRLIKISRNSVDQLLRPEVPRRKAVLGDRYNELTLVLKGGYSIIFRIFDYGMAYRFQSGLPDMIEVTSEQVDLNFAENVRLWFPKETSMLSHNERLYLQKSIIDFGDSTFASLPVYAEDSHGIHILVSEADLYDYPCMFLKSTGGNGLSGIFPKRVLITSAPESKADRNEIISGEAESIALTKGTRSFPWRLFYISDRSADLFEHDLVYQLSRPSKMKDISWIQPGKVAWDWWNANNIYGVDFKAGINTATYKYYIDFAARYGLQYIVLDEGWSKTTTNIKETNPDLDIAELVRYGKEKNVGIILWMLWKPLDKDLEAVLDTYKSWGIRGIKVDFMQRSDQYMVDYYERVAIAAAQRQLLVDFHGAFKPNGLHRAWPNVISYEGVKGLEVNKWDSVITPGHDVTLPYIRNVAGPMDYTPGAMDNAQSKDFFPRFDRPMSHGTRCHQLAMYIVYESPLQMLADCPSNYYKEKECTEFIAAMPTTWEDTKFLSGSVGEYIAIARRKEGKWYVGVMNGDKERDLEIDCSFFGSGDHKLTIMQDGINANMNGNDYKKSVTTISAGSVLKLHLADGGGWAAIIE